MQTGNPYYVQPGGDYSQGLAGLSATFEKIGEQRRKDEAQQRASVKLAKMKADAITALRSNDPDKVSEFMVSNPEMSQAMKTSMEFKNKITEDDYRDSLFDVYLNPTEENVKEVVEKRQALLTTQGVTPENSKETDGFMAKFSDNPEEVKKQIAVELAFRYPKKWKAYRDATKTEETKEGEGQFTLSKDQKRFDAAGNVIASGPVGAKDDEDSQTTDTKNFDRYLELLKKDPEKAKLFGNQIGLFDEEGNYAPVKLTKYYEKLDALPPGHERRESYQTMIDQLLTGGNPELEREIAQMIVDEVLDWNKLSRRGKQKGRIAKYVKELDPDFNLIDAEANIKYKTDAANLKSIALIAGIKPLFKELKGQAAGLNNGVIPVFNKGYNFWKLQTGEAKIVAFNNLRDDVIAETERVLLGTGVISDSKYLRALGNLNTSQSPKQMAAAIQQIVLVVKKREEALKTQPYPQDGAGDKQENTSDIDIVNTKKGDTYWYNGVEYVRQ